MTVVHVIYKIIACHVLRYFDDHILLTAICVVGKTIVNINIITCVCVVEIKILWIILILHN